MHNSLKKVCVLLVFCVLLTGCFKKDNDKNTKNESTKVELKEKNIIKDQKVDGLKISDVKMEVVDGITTFNAKVTNVSEEDIEVDIIRIIVKDEKDKEIAKLTGYVGETLKPNDSKDIINTTDIDLSAAKSVSYKKE